jgi:chromosome segregation ATPase
VTTPAEQIAQLKKTQSDQQKQIDTLTSDIGKKLSTSDFENQLQAAQDKEEKEKNGKVFDDPDWYQPTAGAGQKSEWNIAKEEINGLNAAVNVIAASLIAVEFSWSLFKIEFKPFFTPRWVDRVNEAIGRLQDRRGWNNPEGDAERRLVRIETRLGRLDTAAGHLQNRANDAHVRISGTNKRVDELQRKAAEARRALRSNDTSARSTSLGGLSGAEADVRRLELRVQALVRTLG